MSSDPGTLFSEASQGDEGAVLALLERFAPDLQLYVARHAGELVRRQESASDLAQSVCREALESLRSGRFRYQGEGPFRQWLYRAAVMKLLNRHRHWNAERRDPRRATPLAAGGDDSLEPARAPEPADSATPSLDAVWSEELERFQAAFAQLSERHQEVVRLHHVDGLSHAEIAARLETSEANSRMLLSRALGRLATLATPPRG